MASPKVSPPDAAIDKAVVSAAESDSTNGSTPSEAVTPGQIDDLFKELKTLLTTVEKLQKAREEVGDIKPLLMRLLDGELVAGDELERLKAGVGGLSKLVKLYGDYQLVLEKAQPARGLLDDVLKS